MVLLDLSLEDLKLILEGANFLLKLRVLFDQDIFLRVNVFNLLGISLRFLKKLIFQRLDMRLKLILRFLILRHFLVLLLKSSDSGHL
jgi:hypothetical protein